MHRLGARGLAAPAALHEIKGGILFRKRGTPRERLDIAGEQLEELQCLPIALPCARRCRVWNLLYDLGYFYYPLPLC